jgi:DNA polymerase-3 subunit beta
MPLKVNRDDFSKALSRIVKIAKNKTTIPILNSVLLKTAGKSLEITACNLDCMAQTHISLPAKSPAMSCAVDAEMLAAFAARAPEEIIALEQGESTITIKSGRARATLNTLPPDDFPILSEPKPESQFEMAASDLLQLIDLTSYAASDEESRFYLCGIFFEYESGFLVASATNGHILGSARVGAQDNAQGFPSVILPSNAISQIVSLLKGVAGDIEIKASRKLFEVITPDVNFITKLIDGTYPDYRGVIPALVQTPVTLIPRILLDAVDRVRIARSAAGNGIALEFSPGTLKLQVSTPERGTVEDQIDVEGMLTARIGFNGAYLADTLKAFKPDEPVELHSEQPGAPTLLRSVSAPDAHVHVIMPLRI